MVCCAAHVILQLPLEVPACGALAHEVEDRTSEYSPVSWEFKSTRTIGSTYLSRLSGWNRTGGTRVVADSFLASVWLGLLTAFIVR